MKHLLNTLFMVGIVCVSSASFAKEANKKIQTSMIELPIKFQFIVDKNRCEYSDYLAQEVYVECSYSIGGVPPKGGQIIFPDGEYATSGVTGDLYFEYDEIFVEGGVVSIRFFEQAWIDDNNEGVDGNKFYEEVKKYFDENVVTFEFVYVGPDFEFDEKRVGESVQ